MPASPELIQSVVAEVLSKLGNGKPAGNATPVAPAPSRPPSPAPRTRGGRRPGVFEDPADAIAAAGEAQRNLTRKGYAARRAAVGIVKDLCAARDEEWGKLEFEETTIGRLEHKIAKLTGIPSIPGVEWLSPLGMSGDHGISMEENAPFGVIAAITPVTHSIPTIAANAISMIAAGNTVVFNAHPSGAKCAAAAIAAFNEGIERKTGISNLLTIVEKPSLESFNALVSSDGVNLICVTGGPAVVAAAMKSGKRAICAGPGNPPVVVDETADPAKAARDIITGAAFDNDLLCIGEKQVFVVDSIFDAFMEAMGRNGGRLLNRFQLRTLADNAFTEHDDGGGCSHAVVNREFVGADAAVLARVAGAAAPPDTRVVFAEAPFTCPFVQEEQMMPMLPIVRVKDADEGIDKAHASEHGYGHSAMIHTQHVGRMTRMGRVMDCTLFIKNGSCLAGLGTGGEGYASFSIATTTGEGITTPMTFTRKRRCVMVDNLNLVT